MRFQPIQQLNVILKQEYFEPTISWALRVVLALNIPLIIIPLFKGFSDEVIWAAFGAYMVSLIDYRGTHYKKILIQSIEGVLIFISGIIGMNVAGSIIGCVIAMFLIGIFAALIRNWSNYGASIGVAVGFFFLFGLSNPVSFDASLKYGFYVLAGAGWAIVITIISFPFRPSNPVRRSVANIWKANTDFLDGMIQKYASTVPIDNLRIIEKEIATREAINQSIKLFSRRQKEKTKLQAQHYDMMMELRSTASLFAATLNTMNEELEMLNNPEFLKIRESVLYKTLSSFGQASARLSIVMFTFRPEDLTLAKIRVKRCEIAIGLLNETCQNLKLSEKEIVGLHHFIETLKKSFQYLNQTISQIEEKLNFQKSDYLENYKLSFNNFLVGLKPRALMELIREAFNFNSEHFTYALRVAIGLCIGVFIYKFLEIDHGHWIALTMMIVIQPYFGATRKKGIERIIGTVGGIILGGVIMLLPLPHQVFVGMLVIVSFFVAYFLRNNYKIGVFFTTIMMVVLMQLSQQGSWELIGWRVLSTLIGALLALIVSYVFWPVWEKERFPILMTKALTQNKNYLEQVVKYYNKELPAGETWYKCRRVAEGGNNTIFACVQRMVEEPQHIQNQIDFSFAMAGINIRIAREITSVALMVSETQPSMPIVELRNYFNKASEIFDWIIFHISEPLVYKTPPDFNIIKETLNAFVFSKNEDLLFIKVDLEKIIFELETICALIEQQKKSGLD
ncbi:MAG: FUSC family protein [Burkholderiales bacterium]|nr:FUSC family protein [Bacteroidia bacterium]